MTPQVTEHKSFSGLCGAIFYISGRVCISSLFAPKSVVLRQKSRFLSQKTALFSPLQTRENTQSGGRQGLFTPAKANRIKTGFSHGEKLKANSTSNPELSRSLLRCDASAESLVCPRTPSSLRWDNCMATAEQAAIGSDPGSSLRQLQETVHPFAHPQYYNSIERRLWESRRLRSKPRTALQADEMNNPRTWNRREFAVTQNGYFTILRPTGWFSATRLPGSTRYLAGKSREATSPQELEYPTGNPATTPPPGSAFAPVREAPFHADSRNTAMPLQFMSLTTQDHRLMRPALIVLAASAITWILLWCLAHP